jgi:hypothetical protein
MLISEQLFVLFSLMLVFGHGQKVDLCGARVQDRPM